MLFAPPEAHGVERLKQKISVREQWLATCSHSPRREECYLYASGFTHALYIWRELAPLTARACLPETWDNEQAVVAISRCWRSICDDGCIRLSIPLQSGDDAGRQRLVDRFGNLVALVAKRGHLPWYRASPPVA
jgi:hypothetical protein